MLSVFRTHPLIHVSYLIALVPGICCWPTARCRRPCSSSTAASSPSRTPIPTWASGRWTDLRQPELPPHPSQAGRAPGRQPRLRADDLGPALPPGGVPDRRDHQDRHRAAGPPADRRAGRARAPATSRSSRPSSSPPFRPLDADRSATTPRLPPNPAPVAPASPGDAQRPGTVDGVLAVHLLWTDDDGGGFLLWGEDSDLPPSGPPRRGRNPRCRVPRPHPFTASAVTPDRRRAGRGSQPPRRRGGRQPKGPRSSGCPESPTHRSPHPS